MCTKSMSEPEGNLMCSFRYHLLCLDQLASKPQGPPVSMSIAGTTNLNHHAWFSFLYVLSVCVCDCGSVCYDIHMKVRGQILELTIPFHCVLGTKLSYQIWQQTTLNHLANSFLFFRFIFMYKCCKCSGMCRGQRGCKTLWSWSYRWPLAVWQGCWELNLGL